MISARRVYDIVNLALREVGVVSLGDSIAPDVAQEALLVLNSIRAGYSLGTKNNEIYDEVYTATENRLNITLGTDGVTPGDIPVRPARITQIVLMTTGINGLNINLAVRAYEQYRQIPVSNIVSLPDTAYIDTGYPYQRVWLFPGIATGWALRVQGLKYMTEYEALDDVLVDPPEWFEVMYLELALRLAPKFGVDLPDAVLAQLRSVLKPLKRNQFMARMHNMPNGIKSSGSSINFFSGLARGN